MIGSPVIIRQYVHVLAPAHYCGRLARDPRKLKNRGSFTKYAPRRALHGSRGSFSHEAIVCVMKSSRDTSHWT